MASSKTLLEETTKSTKRKEEKSSKKRKAGELIEPATTSELPPAALVPVDLPVTEDEAPKKSRSTSEIQKEKSSKKRKSSTLNEAVPESIDSAVAVQDQSPGSEGEVPQEPRTKKRKASVDEIEVDVNAPEPPSKKNLRRLKKGKPLPPSKSGAESTPEPEPKKEKKEEEKRSEHGVWIGNLPWSASPDDLRKFVVERSDITPEMITRVHMPNPNSKKSANKVEKASGKVEHNKGFAYVDFSTAEAVEKVVELSEQLLSGRRLLIKNHTSFAGRPEKNKEESRKDSKPPSTRIFLGNLSYDVTEESLKEHFEKCGEIESVKVATFEDSGKCKGYAWIVFKELEAAKTAVRGFVRIEEEVSDASESESDNDDGSGEEGKGSSNNPKKTKTRKWWLNRIKGRPLRMEFAEGADVRYKKRYGKDKTKIGNLNTAAGAVITGEGAKETQKPARSAPEYRRPTKGVEYDRPYGAPRLTGGIVKSEGKKSTF